MCAENTIKRVNWSKLVTLGGPTLAKTALYEHNKERKTDRQREREFNFTKPFKKKKSVFTRHYIKKKTQKIKDISPARHTRNTNLQRDTHTIIS